MGEVSDRSFGDRESEVGVQTAAIDADPFINRGDWPIFVTKPHI